MRVEREFHRPDVVARLENIDEDLLMQMLSDIPNDQAELEAWQEAAIQEGVLDLEAGRVVSDEHVKEWLESLGAPNELPKPTCD